MVQLFIAEKFGSAGCGTERSPFKWIHPQRKGSFPWVQPVQFGCSRRIKAFDVVGGPTGLKKGHPFPVGESTRMLAALSSTFLRFKDSEGRLFFVHH
jgi:hypothetical protein